MSATRPTINNNYLPESPSVLMMPSRLQFMSPNNYTTCNQFTFGSPTQSSACTSSQQMPTSSSRGIFMHRMSAPGLGVSWQHTVPKTMPWSEASAIQFTSRPITSACRFNSRTSAQCSSLSLPQPKPKRHLVTFDDEATPNKRLLTEERMAARMENLFIGKTPAHVLGKDNSNTTDSWEKFLQLEERLKDDEIILEDERMTEGRMNHNGFKISDELKDKIFSQEPFLPQQVLQNLNQPSLQLVLWKPPEGVVSEILEKVKKEKYGDKDSNEDYCRDNQINQSLDREKEVQSINANDISEMDVEMFDNVDDEMLL
ncbi:hypothetical protein SNE40_003821 [Patella caerulea]|uniref:Uncharacterized protein n=1 Tax=Patella caerulea TaxID=87958 RepID=A0AAN8K8S2_PATCE